MESLHKKIQFFPFIVEYVSQYKPGVVMGPDADASKGQLFSVSLTSDLGCLYWGDGFITALRLILGILYAGGKKK